MLLRCVTDLGQSDNLLNMALEHLPYPRLKQVTSSRCSHRYYAAVNNMRTVRHGGTLQLSGIWMSSEKQLSVPDDPPSYSEAIQANLPGIAAVSVEPVKEGWP